MSDHISKCLNTLMFDQVFHPDSYFRLWKRVELFTLKQGAAPNFINNYNKSTANHYN